MTLQIEVVIASMIIATIIMVIVSDRQRRAKLTPEQRTKEDAEPFDDAI